MKIELEGVKKKYRDRVVLDINELQLEDGKIYAVLGPNGSGKTTMLRVMCGMERLEHGRVLYNGSEDIPRSNISFLAQNPYIFDLTVLKNIMLGIEERSDVRGLAEEALGFIGMKSFAGARAVSLSGGEAQRVAVARTLVAGKNLVFLDEPAAAVDIHSMVLVEEYIRFANKRDRSTIIFTTHNPSQALRTADEAIILWDGKVIERGKASAVLMNPQRSETRDFLSFWGR